jgi:predicted  nucleic acid-binding Zn-ribbon protein
MKMDKNRFEQFKGITQLESKYATQLVFTMDDLKWLVAQVEKAERFEKVADELQAELIENEDKIEELESRILKVHQKATEQMNKLEKENENLKQYKKVLMEASVGRVELIKELEKENELLKERLKKANQARYNLGEGM